MPASTNLIRRLLSPGKVFYFLDFEGHTQTKDRYFVVVGFSDTHFFCFTTSTTGYLAHDGLLRAQVTPLIPVGCECFPKECFIDCKELIAFDDIMLSSYLNSGRVTIKGILSPERLRMVAKTVKYSIVLNDRDKATIKSALGEHWPDDEPPGE
jgi:hypothetical protein